MWVHSWLRTAGPLDWIRSTPCSVEPFLYIETEILLGPEHPGQCLAHHPGSIFADAVGNDRTVELIRFLTARLHDLGKLGERFPHGSRGYVAQAKADGRRRPGIDPQFIIRSDLCAFMPRVDRILLSGDHVVIDAIFDIEGLIRSTEDALVIRLVFRKQQRSIPLAIKVTVAEHGMCGCRNPVAIVACHLRQSRF